jgi:hypothetical protein
MYMMKAESKLRSFNVNSVAMYNKFAETQRNRGKGTGERLNELIEKDVKESDPFHIDKSAARTPKINDLCIPNPFVMNQLQSLPIWREYLKTLTKQEIQEAYLHILALQEVTVTFDEWQEEQEQIKELEKKYA